MSTPTGSNGAHAASGGSGRGGDRGALPDVEIGRDEVTRADRADPRATADDRGPTVHYDRPSLPHVGSNGPTMDRKSVVEREKDAHGGVKVGSAFFGWLTATGTAVLLTALLVATGTAVGLANSGSVDSALSGAQSQAAGNAGTTGVAGAIALLVVLLVSFFCGGYVAGRMARFNGAKQGVAVWVWAVVIAVVVAILVAVAGSEVNVLSQLDGIPVDEPTLTSRSIIAVIAALVVALVGAVLGGLAGMRFHRRVDRTGLGR